MGDLLLGHRVLQRRVVGGGVDDDAEAQLGGGADVAQGLLVGVRARDVDHDVLRAFDVDLGLGDAGGVDAALDDAAGLLHRLRARRRVGALLVGGERHRQPALEVETEFRRRELPPGAGQGGGPEDAHDGQQRQEIRGEGQALALDLLPWAVSARGCTHVRRQWSVSSSVGAERARGEPGPTVPASGAPPRGGADRREWPCTRSVGAAHSRRPRSAALSGLSAERGFRGGGPAPGFGLRARPGRFTVRTHRGEGPLAVRGRGRPAAASTPCGRTCRCACCPCCRPRRRWSAASRGPRR